MLEGELTFGMAAQVASFQYNDHELNISVTPREDLYLIEGEGSLTNFIDFKKSNLNQFDISISLISPKTQFRITSGELSEYLKTLCCELMVFSISESKDKTDERVKQIVDHLKVINEC